MMRALFLAALAIAVGAAAGCDDVAPPASADLSVMPDLTVCDPTACPAPATACKVRVCTDNACATENAAAGTACSDSGGVVCDGNGACVDQHCMDQKRDGDETDVDCGGASCGACAIGKSCDRPGDCTSGYCNNHVCSPAPGGTACSANAQCASGVCGTSGSGHCCTAACAPAGGSCGASDCDGSGACVFPSATVSCGAPSCTAAMLTRHSCDGAGTCTASTAACANNLVCANATSCVSMCSGDGDCLGGYYCANGCQPKQANGATCSAAHQCTSGSCADGYCCDVACNGACHACAAALTGGQNGTCAAVTDGTSDPRGACSASAQICRGGACTGVPDAPGAVMATAGAASVTVTWTVPASHGAAIDGYVLSGAGAPITVLPANVCTAATVGSACSYTITPLANCSAYTLGVAAHNADGSSTVASAGTVTPMQLPDIPATPTLSLPSGAGARVTATWSATNGHGCAIDSYDVYITGLANDSDHYLGASTTATFSGLTTCNYAVGTCGASYVFSLRAHNAAGWSGYSPSTSIVPKVSYASDHVADLWSAKTCTGCHASAATPPDLTSANAYANAVATGSLIYQCPEGASSPSCPGHPVLLTSGNLDDATLRQWVADGQAP